MLKIDHRKTLKHLYHPSGKAPGLIDVPPMNFLMLDGRGKPDGKGFSQAAGVLFPLAYTLKWLIRLACDVDFHVMPMEVRWRVDREKKEFAWTMMLMQPEMVTLDWVAEARQKVQSKVDAALLDQIRFETFMEGMCVQFLHVGPYEGMDAAMERMAAHAEQQGYCIPVRSAHDIYLNDIRKTKPENLKAIMRFTVTKNPQRL
ncbi:MAG: GyrI-like domain-containing protein [Chloroflexota bacterium]